MQPEPRVLRARTWNTVGAVVLLVSAAACGGVFVSLDGTEGTRIASALILAATVVLVIGTIRTLVLAVIVTGDGLIVRELLITKKLPWDQLQHTDVVPSKGGHLGFYADIKVTYNPRIYYRVSAEQPLRSVTVTSLRAYRRELAEQRAKEINELIQRHRQPETTPLQTLSLHPTDRSRRPRVRWRRP